MLGKCFVASWGLLAALSSSGCGDPPLCLSDVFVAIQTTQVAVDVDTATPGVQTDIHVRSSLLEGERVRLEVIDPDGVVVNTLEAAVDAGGDATFSQVSVIAPVTTLRATATTTCGRGDDEATLEVSAGAGCELVLTPTPEANTFYAPLGVLSTVTDPDPTTPGYQTSVLVATRPGWFVDLFENRGKGEMVVASGAADPQGRVTFARTLDDGQVAVRATCRGSGAAASLTTTVVVDVQRPTCTFTNPSPGSTITPAFDQNGNLADGVQLAVAMSLGGSDVAGEPVTLAVKPVGGTATMVPASVVAADGTSTAAATLAPPTTPASFELALLANDHAGNTCSSIHTYDVVYNGCDISITSPTAAVTADADANPGNGSQVDVTLQVATACAGRMVTSTCGTDSPGGIVPVGGLLVLRPTVCTTSPCETSIPCEFHVTTTTGVETVASTTIDFDDQGPPVSLQIVNPALACNVQITPATDADPTTDGVQLVARVSSATAASKALELTNSGGTSTFDASNDVTVTLAGGINRLVGTALDALGNSGQTPNCNVTLADLSVSFSPPAADGIMGRKDGAVNGNAITFPLCGTVNQPGASVQLVIDGGGPVAATVVGTTWCRTVTLAQSPPSHTIVANATAGTSFGTGSLVLRIDLTPPPAALGFTALALNRQRVRLSWDSPSDGGQPVAAYVVKHATTVLTEANFDTTGTVLPTGTPGVPGTDETVDLFPARTGTAYWLGVATLDAANNRSTAAVLGPITPGFDRSGAIFGPSPSQGLTAIGYAIAHGRFNNDDFDDVAISAATQNNGATVRTGAVYVYFGGPSGIAPTPSVSFTQTVANGKLGSGLAAVRWSSTTRDDLVIGAPGVDGHGHIFVFRGGATFPTGAVSATTADLHIAANSANPGWFANSGLGSTLASADVDGDGTADLIASAPGGGGAGGVAILYGGTVTINALLSDTDQSGIGGAIVELFRDPGAQPGHQLGFYLHAVGRTEGASDLTEDLVVAYADDFTTAGDSLFVLRSDGMRPASAGVTDRAFTIGRDVRIDFATTIYRETEWGSQAITVQDQNGDGARDLVIAAYRLFNGGGQVLIIDGNTTGVGGVARTTDAGVTLTAITGTGGSRFGAAILAHDSTTSPDIDGDGLEDLFIAGAPSNVGRAFIWFGGSIPVGAASVSSAHSTIDAPSTFTFLRQPGRGFGGQARWVGDLDNDGLDDLCWASPFDNTGDGSFEILAD